MSLNDSRTILAHPLVRTFFGSLLGISYSAVLNRLITYEPRNPQTDADSCYYKAQNIELNCNYVEPILHLLPIGGCLKGA